MTTKKHIQTGIFPRLSWQVTGSGPALVLLHGFPANGSLWSALPPLLQGKMKLIMPDLPGSGGSSLPSPGPLRMEDMAAAVSAIMEEEGTATAVIAGHSMGGYAALAFAEAFPEKTAGIALIHSGAWADDEEKKEARQKSVRLILEGGKEVFTRQMIPNLFAAAFRESHPETVRRQTENALAADAAAMAACYTAMMSRPDRTGLLNGTRIPVMFVTGHKDTITPSEKIMEQAALPLVSFIATYEACGHMSMLEAPDRLSEDLNRFVQYCTNL